MAIMKTLTINGTTYTVAPVVPALSVTLLADKWVSEDGRYSQVVAVEGVTSRSKVDLQPTPEQLVEFHEKVLGFTTENKGGEVKAFAIGDRPRGDHTIQVTLTEVEGTGTILGNTVGTTMPRANLAQEDPTKADYVLGRGEFVRKTDAYGGVPVKNYGASASATAKENTDAFQAALAAERVVYVPGGTYKLDDGLVIGDNCCLELAQDAVLEFTQSGGNCITLGMLSTLKGNHATVKVPYEFSGNVLYAYSNDHTDADINAVPPFSKWDPQWKSGRYVTDLNICKADSRGFHYSIDGECRGTAVYLSADNTAGLSTFMWGIHFSGLRIAGAFSYGIHAVNFDDGWMHEMRIDAFLDGCEIGVCLDDCNNAYISAIIQPRRAYSLAQVYKPYAKHGIKLINSKNVDLSGSRVWDWNATNTLWTDGGEYQHIAMIGECRGAILNDFYYYETSIDIRKQIYTDMASNLEQMTILQEPIDRWFKVRNGEPYYNDGYSEHKLVTQKELDDHFNTDYVKYFTDVLPTAIDTDGSIYNGVGYRNARADSKGGNIENDSPYYMMTGYIPCNKSSMIDARGFGFANGDENCRVILFDAGFKYVQHVNRGNLLKGNNYFVKYIEKEDGFTCQLGGTAELTNVAYARFIVHKQTWTDHPMIAVDEEIKYTIEGFLGDGVKVKGENIVGVPGQETPDWTATKEESGGDVIVIAEQTLTSGMWGKRQWDIVPGIYYEVYINGARYTCEAYNYDGGIILGNYTISLASANVPHNNEPFYIYWAGGSATAGMFGKDSTLSYPITLKVTDNIVTTYNKLPVEYLPDDIGGGVDVTASVGQTIVVKEVDDSGKPTKWEAVDYQPRTHWSEEGKVPVLSVPFGISAPNSTYGAFTFGLIFNEYVESMPLSAIDSVEYDGVEYANLASFAYQGMQFFGNLYFLNGMFGTSFGNTGEPFIIGGNTSGMLAMTTDTESTKHTIQIYIGGTYHHRIDRCYQPQLPVIDITDYPMVADGSATKVTISGDGYFENVYRVLKNGMVKIIYATTTGDIYTAVVNPIQSQGIIWAYTKALTSVVGLEIEATSESATASIR